MIGYWSHCLGRETLIPVASPRLGCDFEMPMPLISTEVDGDKVGDDWLTFANCNDLCLEKLRSGPWRSCSHYQLALEMAKVGIGAALVPDFIAAQNITAGDLVRLPGHDCPTGKYYYLQIKFERRKEQNIAKVSTWIKKVSNGKLLHF